MPLAVRRDTSLHCSYNKCLLPCRQLHAMLGQLMCFQFAVATRQGRGDGTFVCLDLVTQFRRISLPCSLLCVVTKLF
jgi:hypothetical protein